LSFFAGRGGSVRERWDKIRGNYEFGPSVPPVLGRGAGDVGF